MSEREERFESQWGNGSINGVGGGGRLAKPIISCAEPPLSAVVKCPPSQTWMSEASTAFRRDITKREIITGIKLGVLC